ncbi:hypothetical protein BJV78DRAFT_1103663, partial [Lactifluus subvellereus]
CHTGGTQWDMQERFQRSPNTISVVFNHLLDIMVSKKFYSRYVKLPPSGQTPPEIHENPKLYPFLKGCLGAIDGTHIDVFVPDDALARYRNRK